MIRHPELVEDFERSYAARHPLNYRPSLAIYEALYEHAKRLGVLADGDILDGIEIDVRLAHILNVRSPA